MKQVLLCKQAADLVADLRNPEEDIYMSTLSDINGAIRTVISVARDLGAGGLCLLDVLDVLDILNDYSERLTALATT